jgi:sirohydrochlorin cobaltochelatase
VGDDTRIAYMNGTAIILLGHGSHRSPETADAVWRQVDRLRADAAADEVAAAFWKEQPGFHSVLATVAAARVVVLPLFAADGFFTRQVIPTALGLPPGLSERDGRTFFCCAPIGTHPSMHALACTRIRAALRDADVRPADAAVTVIGHGTRRQSSTQDSARTAAAAISAAGLAAEVVPLFLEGDPNVRDWRSHTEAPTVLCLPFFVAMGQHADADVSAALGLSPGQRSRSDGDRQVHHLAAIGSGRDLDDGIDAALRASGLLCAGEPAGDGSVWNGMPAAGREQLWATVNAGRLLAFGDLQLAADVVRTGDGAAEFHSPAALRDHLRRAPFRPLASARDLPHGWRCRAGDASRLHAIVETVYPGAVAAWAGAAEPPVSLADFCARQVGDYQRLTQLDAATESQLVTDVCGGCVLAPAWAGATADGIPCRAPCDWWLSAALATSTRSAEAVASARVPDTPRTPGQQ